MVSILPGDRSGLEQLGRYVGGGMQNALPQQYENMKYQRGQDAITKLQQSMKNPGQDQGDVLAELARAISANPNLERSGLAEYIGKLAQSKAAQGIPPPGGKSMRDREPIPEIPQRKEVNSLNQPSKTYPDVIGPKEKTGNVSQEATEGIKKPIKSADQMRADALKRSEVATKSNFPLSPQEAFKDEVMQNEENKAYNTEIDKETLARKSGQKEYGAKAENALVSAYSAASPKMKAMAKKWGEDISKTGKSESEIEEYIIEKANKFANSINNIKGSLSRPNAINNVERAIGGDYKTFDQGVQDVRNHLKPLLEMGLYDEAKGLLEELNYGPEEREMIVNPLSERGQTALNALPKISGTRIFRKASKMPEADINDLKNVLVDLKEQDPNFSPLLARKYAEDRGYDWRLFKDAWNELIQEDMQNPEEGKMFKLTADQNQMSGRLDTPPLDMIGKILHGLELRGR